MQQVHDVQSKRTPTAWEVARLRIEGSRQHEVSDLRGKAAMRYLVRSRSLADVSAEEDDDMLEVANVVRSADAHAMLAIGSDGVAEPHALTVKRATLGGGNGSTSVGALMQQLRVEPSYEAERAAKFLPYEGCGAVVGQTRAGSHVRQDSRLVVAGIAGQRGRRCRTL